ncbi:MAG: exodeoxyribonuclease VII large subunit, partial [candidate division Zixibacteria bacterium]|nr:exodeoxyribonuclease VII large subunit [candidate division Zixibacteria bacterium]
MLRNKIEKKVYTVTAITRLIKYTLEESWRSICIEGEISNYINHRSGHRYLSLKDENATIRLTIWRSVGQSLKFEPEDGMKVRAWGDISVYEKGGSYQLNVRKLEPLGVGELEVAFRQLYKKLDTEGLFDDSLKKPLPNYARKIGIVTSPTGAAIRDIVQIAKRRNDTVQLIIYPAQVQGDGSAESIVSGIEYLNSRDDIDLIIIGRGGGSLEDLWAFNEEILVRAIAKSEKPVISAVGHEIDTTLSDMVADLRAPTPSAASELAVWDKTEYENLLSSLMSQMDHNLDAIFESGRYRLSNLALRPVYKRPESMVYERQQS